MSIYSFGGYLLSAPYVPNDGDSAVNNIHCDDTSSQIWMPKIRVNVIPFYSCLK